MKKNMRINILTAVLLYSVSTATVMAQIDYDGMSDRIATASGFSLASYNTADSKGLAEKITNQYEIRNFTADTLNRVKEDVSKKDSFFGGLVGYKEVNGKAEIVVSFRGTDTNISEDLKTDAFAYKKKAEELGLTGYVHGGIYDRFQLLRTNVMSQIQQTLAQHGKAINDVNFLVTGHSLGGALATLFAADAKKNLGVKNLKLVTFGSPRVADETGALEVEKVIGEDNAYRVWNDNDIIPTVSVGTDLGTVGYIGLGAAAIATGGISTLGGGALYGAGIGGAYVLNQFSGFKHVGQSIKLEAVKTDSRLSKNLDGHSMKAYFERATSQQQETLLDHVGIKDKVKQTPSKIVKGIKKVGSMIKGATEHVGKWIKGLFTSKK